jgi:hypothetical protein
MAEVTIRDYLNRVKAAKEKLPDVVNDALLMNESKIVDLNKGQLYDGKDILGNDIRPFYSQDTFFKTQAQAQGYIKWKQKITPNSSRNPDAPNLFINGFHYSLIGLLKKGRDIVIGVKSQNQITSSIDGKYENIYGLNPDNQSKVDREITIPAINDFLKRTL